MANELTITPTTNAATNGTWTITGNWELRAGSQDTEEWLGADYPGDDSITTSFGAKQTDAATGYDSAPKMALVALTGGSSGVGGQIATLSGGATSILSVMVTGNSATEVVHSATWSGLTLTVHGLADTLLAHVMVIYN
mgnify:CR=1 FL=1